MNELNICFYYFSHPNSSPKPIFVLEFASLPRTLAGEIFEDFGIQIPYQFYTNDS